MKRSFITEKRMRKINRRNLNGRYVSKVEACCDDCEQQGEGVIDYITDKFKKFKTSLTSRPKVLNDLMEKTKGVPVVSLKVGRSPITPMFQKILNIATFGKMKAKMKELAYDSLFHLFVVFELQNGQTYIIEKNERVTVDTKVRPNAEYTSVLKLSDGKDIKTYIENVEATNYSELYVYDSFTSNCQDFIRRLMNANGIEQFNDFITQNTSVLAPTAIKKIAKGATDVAGVIDRLVKGGSYHKGAGFADFFVPDVTLEDNVRNFSREIKKFQALDDEGLDAYSGFNFF